MSMMSMWSEFASTGFRDAGPNGVWPYLLRTINMSFRYLNWPLVLGPFMTHLLAEKVRTPATGRIRKTLRR